MEKYIPTNVVRKIIADILIERGNRILAEADRIADEEIKRCGFASQFQGELETTSAGTYVLADDVLNGQISLQEAIQVVLSQDEVNLAKTKCEEWLNKQNEIER